MTENRAMLIAAAAGVAVTFGFSWWYRGIPRHKWPWWANAVTAASSAFAAASISRYTEKRRVRS